MKTPKPMIEAQNRYIDRNKKKGMTRVNVWIPDTNADDLREIAADMRKGKWSKNDG